MAFAPIEFLKRAIAGGVDILSMAGPPDRSVVADRIWAGASAWSGAGQFVSEAAAFQLWSVQATLEGIAGPISSLPIMIFERLAGDARRPAREHPLFWMLNRQPNRRQTAQEYWDEQVRHLAWRREAFAIIWPDSLGGLYGELELVHPDRVVDVARRRDGWTYYAVRDLAPSVGYRTFREDQVHHIRRAPLTASGLRSRPVWETGRETLGRALAVEQFGNLYFANGSHGGGILEHPGNFKSKEDEQSFLETWRAGGTGANRHRDRLTKFGVKYHPPQTTNEASQFLESKKQAGYEVAALWNMPPHRVGMLDRATNSNIEQQSLEFVIYTLGPHIAAIEQALTRDLLMGDATAQYFLEFNVAGLLRGDLKTRWAAYFQGRQGGWLSINDVRRLENMSPIGEAGDIYETALNMKPAAPA